MENKKILDFVNEIESRKPIRGMTVVVENSHHRKDEKKFFEDTIKSCGPKKIKLTENWEISFTRYDNGTHFEPDFGGYTLHLCTLDELVMYNSEKSKQIDLKNKIFKELNKYISNELEDILITVKNKILERFEEI